MMVQDENGSVRRKNKQTARRHLFHRKNEQPARGHLSHGKSEQTANQVRFRRKNKQAVKQHWFRRLTYWAVMIAFIASFALGILYLYLLTQPLPDAYTPQTSRIYDQHGELIDTFHIGENRQWVTLEQVSPYLVQATLAIEDHRFYDHFGIDLIGLGRATWVDIKTLSKAQGASTISQQLARNLYLTNEKTWTRKIKEALLTIQLEMKYDKQEILTNYLNQIYFGHATYGIQTASQLFFNKDAIDLTLAESALLAGVPKGPRYYSPYYDEENALTRQKIVLQSMVAHGYITQDDANEALKETLEFQPLVKNKATVASYFGDYVRQQAMGLLGLDEEAFNEGGFNIHTTLDLRIQHIAEEVVNRHLDSTELQVALVAIDPRNGHVKAMIGGRDYAENQYNRVFATTRQPGSSFKPFVYIAALEQGGFTATKQYRSEPTIFHYDEGRGTYSPRNYGNRYMNEDIDLRQAISSSDNVFAVHTIMEIGAEQVVEMARRFGFRGEMQPLPSLALGTFPVSPYEMATAFATLAYEGVRQEPIIITSITDHYGQVLYESEPVSERVIAPEYTYIITSLLEEVFEPGGTGHRVASFIKRPVAAKTGTTNTDAWMVGYTPELSTAVWVGHDRDRHLSSVEALLAAPIFAEFTELALQTIPPKLFPVPEGVVSVYIDPQTGQLATEHCTERRLEHFVRGTEPLGACMLHHVMIDDVEEVQPLQPNFDDQHDSWWSQLKQWWSE